MKNFTLKFLTVFIIATMMLSTVAMAAEGKVNVYVETPDIKGLGEVSQTEANVLWGNLNLSDRVPNVVETSESVLNFKNFNTAKQAMVVSGFIIPKESKTGFSFIHDDGIKVFIKNQDGSKFVTKENWILTGETTMTFTETLEINKVYPIRIEYFDWGGTEVLKTNLPFNWFHDSIPSYTVTYKDGESVFSSSPVAHGLTAVDIAGPVKKGFIFDGWKLGDNKFNFKTPIIGDLTLTASWIKDVNLWVSVDDAADNVYVNGNEVTDLNPSLNDGLSHWGNVATTFVYDVSETPFVAAKAKDLHDVIAGFNLVLKTEVGNFVETTSNWYYYYNPEVNNGVPVTYGELEWFDEDYVGEGWLSVSTVTPHGNWVSDSAFPANALNNVWIWSENHIPTKTEEIDTPIYLRSSKPATAPVDEEPVDEEPVDEEPTDENPIDEEPVVIIPQVVNYTLTVLTTEGGSVPGFEGTNSFSTGTNVNLTVVPEEGYRFTGWTGDVTNNVVVMNESKTITANFALIIEDEEVAEAVEATEETLSAEVTSDIEETPTTILDETTPEEVVETLPDTSGVAAPIFYVFGSALAGLGLTLKKRKN